VEDDDETLITKIQLEYTSGLTAIIVNDEGKWDIGLLYLTNKNLWFVNREKEKTQLTFENIGSVSDVKSREGHRTTKFSELLKADSILEIMFNDVYNNELDSMVVVAAPRNVLGALKNQLVVRTGKSAKRLAAAAKPSKEALLRKFATLLHIGIKDEEQLKFFLGVDEKDMVNLYLERSQRTG